MADETPVVRERDWQGFKYFERLLPLLRGLHEVGTERDRAGSANSTWMSIACWCCSRCSIRSCVRCGRCKHVLGCRRLLSQDPVGIQIQAYCAIIACLLIRLWTEKKPTQRTYEMLCLYWMGWANEEELAAHLAKRKSAPAKKRG